MTERIRQEKETVGLMIGIYCRRHHAPSGDLCPECADLLRYACARIDSCPRGDAKTSCRKCPVHCYSPRYRGDIRRVMAYVGPRMLFIHPLAAIRHLLAERF